MAQADVYLYGMTLMTTSHRLIGDFPQRDNYGEIVESHRLPGGETGTCAVVLGSLGLSVRLDGNHQGYNTYSDLESYFASTSVSLELVTYDPDFEGLEDIVFVDQDSRTCFGRFGSFYADNSLRRWNQPDEAAIRESSVAGVDPFFFEESTEAAHLCQKYGVDYATIDCRFESDVHAQSVVNVLSAEFLRSNYADWHIESLFAEYTRRTSGLVIFTFGAEDIWYGRDGRTVQQFRPFRVDVQSSLGAGDSFKAGVIYAVVNGMDDTTLVHFASATAATACMNYPIAENPPTLETISEVAGKPCEQSAGAVL